MTTTVDGVTAGPFRLPARDNPFEMARLEACLRFEPGWIGRSWEEFEASWESFNRRAAIVGPHGTGKTTFLEAFCQRLERDGFRVHHRVLHGDTPRPPEVFWGELADAAADQAILCLDGYEQLGAWQRRRFVRVADGAGGVLISTHGRAPYPVLLRTQASRILFGDLVRNVDPVPRFSQSELDEIYDHCEGNLRDALRLCYDRVSRS